MNLLWHLTARGTLMFLLVAGLDRLLSTKISARGRRIWWMLVPLAFLVSIPVLIPAVGLLQSPKFPRLSVLPAGPAGLPDSAVNGMASWIWDKAQTAALSPLAGVVIGTGGAAYMLLALARAMAAGRHWGRARLSTDAALLGVLEDCKAEAQITAPIGLVISDAVMVPLILGWLRPRILLPVHLVSSISPEQLRGILFHELAHFRGRDVPLNWLFTLACALHWFNPAAHLALRAWTLAREEAADEAAIAWLKQPSGLSYGDTLLRVLRVTHAYPLPFSALAIVESVGQLKKRIIMIKQYQEKSPRGSLLAVCLALVAFTLALQPTPAGGESNEPQAVATGTMQKWLEEVDNGKYAESWQEAAPLFRNAVSEKDWSATLTKVRTPLGHCTSRKLVSASRQSDLPSPAGAIESNFILAQFDSSFDGLKYAVETVTFSKVPDGSWKAAGYYIKPKV